MSAYTPGPWTLLLDSPRKNKRERMALVATPNGRMAIDCTNSGATYREDCANARLIAAAPRLLTSLKSVLEYMPRATAYQRELWRQAEEAIAQAEGGEAQD